MVIHPWWAIEKGLEKVLQDELKPAHFTHTLRLVLRIQISPKLDAVEKFLQIPISRSAQKGLKDHTRWGFQSKRNPEGVWLPQEVCL